MKETILNHDLERFRAGAANYAAYLDKPEGRLRLDLSFANVKDFLPRTASAQSLVALDIGGGTGAMAVRLAQLGLQVTVLDSSVPMLEIAKRAAQESGLADRILLKHGDAAELETLFPAAAFDVILCHNVLEYVDDPVAVLRSAARSLRDASSMVSVLVRNRAGEVLKSAIKDGDLAASECDLTAEWGCESLYGGRVRLFTAESLEAMLLGSSLAATAKRGVRVVSDYLPPNVCRDDEYQNIFELDHKLGSRPEFAAVARYTHWLAHRLGPAMKDEA